MNVVYLSFVAVLLLSLTVGLWALFGRYAANSLLAVLFFGTAGVALVLALGSVTGMPRGLDVALVFALLASVLGVAFVLRGWPPADGGEP